MTDPVFIHPLPDGLQVGDIVQLTGAEARHSEVKRMKPGETVVVTNGVDRAIAGTFTTAGIEITQFLDIPTPTPRVTVVQAIPKTDRAELAVDLMVQAGVDHIIPWAANRCIARWEGKVDKAKARWEKAALSAAKQSRRVVVPPVADLLTNLDQLPGRFSGNVAIAVLHESATAGFRDFIDQHVAPNNATMSGSDGAGFTSTASAAGATACAGADDLVLVIGPEGGVSPEELDQLSSLGAQAVVLGSEVLRTATAGAIALGAIGALTGRWNTPTINTAPTIHTTPTTSTDGEQNNHTDRQHHRDTDNV